MIDIVSTKSEIKINTGKLSDLFTKGSLPLKFLIVSNVSKDVKWEVELSDLMWATYPKNEIYDIIVLDNNKNFVYQESYDVMKHGSNISKSLFLYCKNLINKNLRPRGLAIGTHDGEFGEWVPLITNYLSDIYMVEGSENQFKKLVKNFKEKPGTYFINEIISTDGKEVEFFEGGKGYTNSIVERVIRNWEIEEIKSTKKKSKSISKLIDEIGKIDWLHLDVEGLDVKLIMSIDDTSKLPNLLIFENNNLLDGENSQIDKWLTNLNYEIYTEDNMTMASKKLL